jgi:hypothetical protein
MGANELDLLIANLTAASRQAGACVSRGHEDEADRVAEQAAIDELKCYIADMICST